VSKTNTYKQTHIKHYVFGMESSALFPFMSDSISCVNSSWDLDNISHLVGN